MCCNQKRAVLQSSSMPTKSANVARPPFARKSSGQDDLSAAGYPLAPGGVSSSAVRVQYLGSSPIRVHGAVTGQAYDFSRGRPPRAIDRRDLPGFLLTSLFRLV